MHVMSGCGLVTRVHANVHVYGFVLFLNQDVVWWAYRDVLD